MIFHVKATSPKATGMMIKRNFVCNSVAYILRSKTEDLEKFYTEVSSVVGTCVPMEEDPNTGDKTGVMYTHIKHPWHKYSSSYSHSLFIQMALTNLTHLTSHISLVKQKPNTAVIQPS